MSKEILPEDASTSLFLDEQKVRVHIMEEKKIYMRASIKFSNGR